MASPTLLFFLNGEKVEVAGVHAEVTLLEFLRERGLTGTKLGCGEVSGLPLGRVMAF